MSNPRDYLPTVQVTDGLTNLVTSLGSASRDPATQNFFYASSLTQSELDASYQNWIMRKAIDIPVNDAFRKDRYVLIDDKDADKVNRFYDLENSLGLKSKFSEAAKLGRLYGGAVVVIGTSDLDWAQPIKPNAIVTHLLTLSRHDVTRVVVEDSDIRKPNYRQAKAYRIDNTEIHYSRVIRFDGDLLPYSAFCSNNNWHGSTAQRLMDSVKPAQAAIQNCETLISQLSTDVFKTPDFMSKLASMGEESAMIDRFRTAAYMRSNLNMMILDSREDYLRQSVTLSGLPETMMSFLHLVAGSADIPFSRFLGDTASGLNTTGEGDQRNYYDHVSADQNTIYAPRYGQIDPLLCNAIWGGVPVGFRSAFEPLWEMSDNERADVELKRAQRDSAYLTAGVLGPDIVARQLQEDETYSIDDEYIEALESYKREEDNANTATLSGVNSNE